MTTRIYLPIDGGVTSKELLDMLGRMGLESNVTSVAGPHISKAVIDAQVGQGLSQFAGIAQVPMDTAPQAVANAISTDRGIALS